MEKLEIVSMWYNEEDLAPFFFNHYLTFADNIHIIVDADTNDKTIDIIKKYIKLYQDKISYELYTFPDMMDDDLKVNKLSETARESKYEWVSIVDSDEFIFEDIKDKIQHCIDKNMFYVYFYQVYRNMVDNDLNPDILPIINQRRYGSNAIMINGVHASQNLYRKPIVFKPYLNICLTPGNHSYVKNDNVCIHQNTIYGSHWMMADEWLAIKRRIYGRKNRQSKNNYEKSYTVQHWKITEEEIKTECKKHFNDLKLF